MRGWYLLLLPCLFTACVCVCVCVCVFLSLIYWTQLPLNWVSPGGSDGKASACNVGDLGSIPGLERFPGEGNVNPLQYACLENSMDGGAW